MKKIILKLLGFTVLYDGLVIKSSNVVMTQKGNGNVQSFNNVVNGNVVGRSISCKSANGDIVINNNGVWVDGIKQDVSQNSEITIIVEGDVKNIDAQICQKISVSGNVGEVKVSTGSVSVKGAISGSVSVNCGSVKCGDIGGSVSVKIGNVS